MSVDLGFAMRVLRLNRQGMTLADIARTLNESEANTLGAHRMLGIALAGEIIEAVPGLPAKVHEAMLDSMPKRMADRIRRIEGERRRH